VVTFIWSTWIGLSIEHMDPGFDSRSGPYTCILSFIGVNINVELHLYLKLIRLRLNKEHQHIVLRK
jgi:hypothetical protein